jgi:hypothetical protein
MQGLVPALLIILGNAAARRVKVYSKRWMHCPILKVLVTTVVPTVSGTTQDIKKSPSRIHVFSVPMLVFMCVGRESTQDIN